MDGALLAPIPTWNTINAERRYTDVNQRFWLERPSTVDRFHQTYAYYQALYGIGYARVRNRISGLWLDANTMEQLDYGLGFKGDDASEFAWAVKIRPEYLLVVSEDDGIERKLITMPYAPSVMCLWHINVAESDVRYAQ